MSGRIARAWAPGIAICAILGCSDSSETTTDTRTDRAQDDQSVQAAFLSPFGSTDDDGGRQSDSSARVADREGALAWLPRDTLGAIRLDQVRPEGEAWDSLAVVKAMRHLEMDRWEPLIEEGISELRRQLEMNVPQGERIWEIVTGLEGEVVVALVSIKPELLQYSGREMPFTMAAYLELGEQSENLRALLAAVVEMAEVRPFFKMVEENRYELVADGSRVEIWVEDSWLKVVAGPESFRGSWLTKWSEMPAERSFLASHVVRDAPAPGAGETLWAEAFINLPPIWSMLSRLAPPEAQEPIEALGLKDLTGISVYSALAGPVFHDLVTIQTRGGGSGCSFFPDQGIDPSWARYVPETSDGGGLFTFDLGSALACLKTRLPTEQQQMFDMGMDQFRQQMGFSLKNDLLDNIGPRFAMATRGEIMSAITADEEFEAVLTMETRDPRKLESLVSRLFDSRALPIGRTPRKIGDVRYWSMSIPLPDVPSWLEPSFGFVGDSMIIATSSTAFQQVVTDLQAGSTSSPDWLERALEECDSDTLAVSVHSTSAEVQGFWGMMKPGLDGAMAASGTDTSEWPIPTDTQVERFASELPESTQWWRRTATGFQYESRSPVSTPYMGAAPIAIVAAIAIPNLMSARLSANESAAIATMRNLASAQAQFQASGAQDRDHDGTGEYGTFGMLAGAEPLHDGEFMNPPVLSSAFGVSENGRVQRSGYLFQVFLTDNTENRWVAYGWPTQFGSTGKRVFCMDQSGDLIYSMNDQSGQFYTGHERVPGPNASEPGPDQDRSSFGTAYFGTDGGFWFAGE